MRMCENTETCPFFNSDVGYSPELNHAMKERFCMSDSSECARYLAAAAVGLPNVPADLLPTDYVRLEAILQ